jgi:hypothetical protein
MSSIRPVPRFRSGCGRPRLVRRPSREAVGRASIPQLNMYCGLCSRTALANSDFFVTCLGSGVIQSLPWVGARELTRHVSNSRYSRTLWLSFWRGHEHDHRLVGT